MRQIGFSTGALARSDFLRALKMMSGKTVNAVELSALRKHELPNLVALAGKLDLSQYEYVSVHAPSSFSDAEEKEIVNQLKRLTTYEWPIVLHPDTIHNFDLWEDFGGLLFIENMDKRKARGHTIDDLKEVFDKLPRAFLCFDIAHAHQVDSSMTEAYKILRSFGSRVRQLHMSELNTDSKHCTISFGSILAFKKVAHLIPESAPAIIESMVEEGDIEREVQVALQALETVKGVLAPAS